MSRGLGDVYKRQESTSSLLKVLMIGIVPLAYLGVGIAVVVKRRRMQNEAV